MVRDPLPEEVPEAPVFYPTAKEWGADPSKYIESISDEVRPFGICKIVPPSAWRPPFRLDRDTFGFRTRVQQINYLDGQARLRLTFVENLCRFLAKRGTPLERLPIVEFRVLDLCCLYREVVTVRGGHAAVSEKKQWSEVARCLGMSPAAGGSIRQHYSRILLPYETHRKEAAERDTQPEAAPGHEGSGTQSPASHLVVKVEEAPVEDSVQEEGVIQLEKCKPVHALGARVKRMAAWKKDKDEDKEAAELLASLSRGEEPSKPLNCSAADGAGPVDTSVGEIVEGGTGQDGADSDDEFVGFGYHDGNKYTLSTYKAMADQFKSNYFGKDSTEVTDQEVELEYWKVVTTAEQDVKIEYGSELHTTIHGSGFPTSGNSLNPLDSATGSQYTRSPWNLNNLNACSLLRYVKEDIPGVISPWVYVGMCFSTFCWHNEDHFLYSINYLWEGEPKQWYGVSGDEAEMFEQAMREYAPELFDQQPDLLFHLVTMISPSILRSKGVNVCKAVQRAGEFMLTFPRAYHGGFNTGYNVAESCNFAVTDWIPWGWLGDQTYKKYSRAQVFSHPGFLISLAENDDSIHTAMWLLPDLRRYMQMELMAMERLRAKGLEKCRPMELSKTGALSKPLVRDNSMVVGKRKRKSKYMTQPLTGMDEIRRARDDDEYIDECFVCRGSTFLALVRCPNCPDKVACVEHAQEMCDCALSHKVLERRYDEGYVESVMEMVEMRANRPAAWKEKAEELLKPSRENPELQPVRLFQSMVTETERFPRFLTWVPGLRDQLKEIVMEGRSWAQRAQALMSLARPQSARIKGKDREKDEDDDERAPVGDLEELVRDAEGIRVLQDDLPSVMDLMKRVNEWRDAARAAMSDGKLDADKLEEMLGAGEALRVQMPEIRKMVQATDQRRWQDKARIAMTSKCRLEELRDLLVEAEQDRFNTVEVRAIRDAVNRADVWRSKLSKARERGTTVAGLRSLLEEEGSLGLAIDVEECKNVTAFVTKCDAWKSRAVEKLEVDKPLLSDLEGLMDEYKALGVYIDTHDPLRSRIVEGHVYASKARKLLHIMLAWDAERQEQQMREDQRNKEHATMLALAACAMTSPSTAGAIVAGAMQMKMKNEQHANGRVSPARSVLSNSFPVVSKSASKRCGREAAAEPPAKRLRKAEDFEHGTDKIYFFTKPLPNFETVCEFMAEGNKLRCEVDEQAAIRRAVQMHEKWTERSLAAMQEHTTSLLDLFKIYHDGVLIGIDIGETGTKLLKCIWSVRVQQALQAEKKDPEGLSTMQEEATKLEIAEDHELRIKLEEAAKNANPVTCFCEQLLKGTPTIECVQCSLSFHQPCLMMSTKDLLAQKGVYQCTPCKRQNTADKGTVLPVGWEEYATPEDRPIYVNRVSRKTSWDLPSGAVAGCARGRLEYVANPCLQRAVPAERDVCQICFHNEEDGDEKLQCRECGLCVHKQCYGSAISSEQPFTCKACEWGVRNAQCPFCPLSGGALKPMTCGGWGHIVCAMYIQELSFADPIRMEPIEGVQSVSKDRRRIKCQICKSLKGAVIQCDTQGCKQSWHPLCGMEAGWYMSMSEDESRDVVNTVCKCPKHGPQDEDESDDDKLYCVCKQRYVEGQLMIECEGCEGWFHPKCVGVSESEVDEIKNWKCVECGAPAATEVVAAGQASLQADGPDGETLPPLGTC